MSLVELMVGMLIGLIGIIIITHLYVTNEEYKRSTTGTGTAQVNGAIALYTLERDLRMAGFGLAHSAMMGCSCATANCSPIQYYYNGTYSYPPAAAAAGALTPLASAPVVITNNTGSPDQITMVYTTANERVLPGQLDENMATPTSNMKVDGTAGFTPNSLVIVAQGTTCALYQITSVEQPTSNLVHTGGPWNPGVSNLPKFDAGATVFNLGTPVWRTYSINATANAHQLQVADAIGLLTGATPTQQLIDDIVDLQAEYGKNTDNDPNNIVDAWSPVAPASAVEWQQVVAVRFAVLARSGNFEKPSNPGDPCSATTVAPTWSGSGTASSVLTIPGGLPSCYRYRVFETVIPLRNMIWRAA
jgi:type IV pilus assembly protein PilW